MAITPQQLYDTLLHHFGHQHWWPVDSDYHTTHGSDPAFEIMIGAILTQNTAWTNVEKALDNLKKHKALTLTAIRHMDEKTLKKLIQPSGFFNQKATRLKHFTTYLHDQYHDSPQKLFSKNLPDARQELLAQQGIGPETADSILLYAGNQPTFVIDAYTRRIAKRLPLPTPTESYDDIQHYVEHALTKTTPPQKIVPLYKELHALIVELAKNYCKKKPRCTTCPLDHLCQKLL